MESNFLDFINFFLLSIWMNWSIVAETIKQYHMINYMCQVKS
jgi:hypothetical protein